MSAAPHQDRPRHVRVSIVRLGLGPLTYRVPPGLELAAQPGVRVSVPERLAVNDLKSLIDLLPSYQSPFR